jgi:hypothetical protein
VGRARRGDARSAAGVVEGGRGIWASEGGSNVAGEAPVPPSMFYPPPASFFHELFQVARLVWTSVSIRPVPCSGSP